MVDTYNRLLGATATLGWKKPCRAATTGSNLFLSGYQTIDGVVFNAAAETAGLNMRVLVKDQAQTSENGIYLANSGLWTREADFDSNADFVRGTLVYITHGNISADKIYSVSSADPQNIGVSAINFQQVSLSSESTTATVAAAATTDLSVIAARIVSISGSGQNITSFGASGSAGMVKFVDFQDSNTLIYGPNLVIPGPSESLVTNYGDVAILEYFGSGLWVVSSYQYASGATLQTGLSTIAISAGTVDLGSVREHCITVDPNGAITSFGSSAPIGSVKFLRFGSSGSLASGSINLPGGSEGITVATGDAAIVRYDGSDIWSVLAYMRGDGYSLAVGQATIASATTTDLGSYFEQSLTISGSVTITSFGTSAPVGAVKFLAFSGSLTLTNSASLILPSGADIRTQAGDTCTAVQESSGVWRVSNFQRATPSGVVSHTSAAATNIGTDETSLMSFALAANSLVSAGDTLGISAWGVTSTSTAPKRVRLYAGSTSTPLLDTGSTVFQGVTWKLDAAVSQTSTGGQTWSGSILTSASTAMPAVCAAGALSLTTTSATTVRVTGYTSAGSSGDITQNQLTGTLLRCI